jgi:ankyrin repeat protein
MRHAMNKRCSICEEEVGEDMIQCPRCGRGVFESEQLRHDSSADTHTSASRTAGIDANKRDNESAQLQNIHDAVARGDLASVQAILAASPNAVHSSDDKGWLPLHVALNGRYNDIARVLVERGADVNRDCGAHFMYLKPLHIAAASGDVTLVRLLISRGADIDCTDVDYRTPLLMAVDKGHIQVVELLVASGARTGAEDITARTPLSIARDRHYDRMIEALTKTAKDTATDEQPKRVYKGKWWQFWK